MRAAAFASRGAADRTLPARRSNDSPRRHAKLVPGGVSRFDTRDRKIPNQSGMDESHRRPHRCGSEHRVRFPFQVVQRDCHALDGLVLKLDSPTAQTAAWMLLDQGSAIRMKSCPTWRRAMAGASSKCSRVTLLSKRSSVAAPSKAATGDGARFPGSIQAAGGRDLPAA
jgi:hypothetical protein